MIDIYIYINRSYDHDHWLVHVAPWGRCYAGHAFVQRWASAMPSLTSWLGESCGKAVDPSGKPTKNCGESPFLVGKYW